MEMTVRQEPAASGRPSGDFLDVFRVGVNDWCIAVGDCWGGAPDIGATVTASVMQAIRAHSAELFLPSAVLEKVNDDLLNEDDCGDRESCLCSVICGRIQVNMSGAWVTLASAGYPRPILVRNAGWTDVRGHVAAPLALVPGPNPGDDRIGLGPGDALAICSDGIVGARDPGGTLFGEEELPEILLDCAGRSVAETADRVVSAAVAFAGGHLRDDGIVVIMRVPEILKSMELARVSAATGVPLNELDLSGYPLADLQSDLERLRPEPPREARFRLAPEPGSIPALRRLLRRLLQSWRMEELGADIELLATEAATVAFMKAVRDVTVILRYLGSVVRVEISDTAMAVSRNKARSWESLGEDGHRLVEALSSRWGVMSTSTGQRLWFEVPAWPSDDT